jgi:hypothetical protein
MKKVVFLALALFPVIALAQVASPTPTPDWAPPGIVITVLDALSHMPVVGPYLVKALAVLATVGTVTTIVATGVMGVLRAVSAGLALAQLNAAADSVDAWYEKVVPYLKFVSLYNSQLGQGSSSGSKS